MLDDVSIIMGLACYKSIAMRYFFGEFAYLP